MSRSDSNIIGDLESEGDLPKESLGEILFDCLRKRTPDDIVNVDSTTEEVLTSGKLLKDTVTLCAALKSLGVKKGDTIAIISENNIRYCVPVVAALYMGVVNNLLNPAYTIGELKHYLLITKPKLIFSSESVLKNVLKVKEELKFIERIILIGQGFENHPGIETLENLLRTTICDAQFHPETLECSTEGAFILLSSGTTGLPKGVEVSKTNAKPHSFINYDSSHSKYGNLSAGDVILLVLPLFHILGLLIQLSTITTGLKMVLMDKFKPNMFLKSIQQHKVTKLILVPPLLSFLAHNSLVDNYDISSIRDIMVGAAAVTEDLLKKARKRLPNATIRQIYGMTEASGGCAFQTFDINKPKSVGILVPNMLAKVWDDNLMENLGPFKLGELCFKGFMIMKEYVGDKIATQNCIDGDGFYHTGDVGFYDQDGHFFIVDRLKELIKYKCFQVSPAELEALILTHDGVEDCAVIGVPNERAGEVPLACVVRKIGETVTEQEIVDFVAERISVHKHLHGGVIFVNEIPKNGTGKILRGKLREIYEISHYEN